MHAVSRLLFIVLPWLLLGGCSMMPAQPLAHTPDFAPVYPLQTERARQATAGIYCTRARATWFGPRRNFQVGDVITVMLNEATQAVRSQNNNVSRDATNNVMPGGLLASAAKLGGLLGAPKLDGGKTTSTGVGTADQKASLTGAVSVTVVDVLPNGNLVLRGEKQLALSEGTEVIQVAGVIRPEDISPNNMVQSRRLVNAQITYRGTGDLAAATRAGWGTSALLKFWPF